MQLVGQAYMDAPTEQPEAVASYEALAEWINKFFERIVGVVDVKFVEGFGVLSQTFRNTVLD